MPEWDEREIAHTFPHDAAYRLVRRNGWGVSSIVDISEEYEVLSDMSAHYTAVVSLTAGNGQR